MKSVKVWGSLEFDNLRIQGNKIVRRSGTSLSSLFLSGKDVA